MKTNAARVGCLAAAAILALFTLQCGSGGGANSGSSVSVAFTSPTGAQTVPVNGTLLLTVSVSGASGSSITWSVNGIVNGNSTYGTITGSGLSVTFNAPAAVPSPATFNITAASSAAPTRFATLTVVISAGTGVSIISPANPQTVTVGSPLVITATVTGNTNTAVTWSVNGIANGNSTFGTISSSGLSATYTAPTAVPSPATFNITATSVADPSMSASLSVTIVPGVAVSIISPSSAQILQLNTTLALTAQVTGTTNTAVTWSVRGVTGGNATYGTITSSGLTALYTAPAAIPTPATFDITVTSVADTTKSASIAVQIVPPVTIAIATPSSPQTLAINSTTVFAAELTGTSDTGVVWTVNGVVNGNATFGTIAGTGPTVVYMAPSAIPTPATFNITATSVADSTKSATVVVTIALQAVAISIISPEGSQTVQVRSGLGLTAAVTGTTNTGVTWTVNGVANGNPTYGVITATGMSVVYTAPTTVPTPATFEITATSVADTTKTASLTVTIVAGLACGTGGESALTGQYAFELKGFTNNGFEAVVGSITAGGNGQITAGELDMNGTALGGATHSVISTTGSFYSLGSDHRGCVTIVTASGATFNTRIDLGPSPGPATSGHIMEFDPASSSAYIASGQLYQQVSANGVNVPNGAYVRMLTGWDSLSQGRVACGGSLTASGGGLINAEQTCNDSGFTVTTPTPGTVGNYIATDASGRFTQTETASSSAFVGYLVPATATSTTPTLLMLSTQVSSANTIVLAGQASLQTGAPFIQSSFSGAFAVYADGVIGYTSGKLFFSHAIADGTSTFTMSDYNENDAGLWNQLNAAITYTYAVDSYGHVTLTPSGTTIPAAHLYLGGPQVIYIGADDGGFAGYAVHQTGSITSLVPGTVFGGTAEVYNQSVLSENLIGTLAASENIQMTADESTITFRQIALSSTDVIDIALDGTISMNGQVLGIVLNSNLLLLTNDTTSTYPSVMLLTLSPLTL